MQTPPSMPTRRTADLLLGRQSVPGAIYFLTLCEATRTPRLTQPAIASAVRVALDQFHVRGDFSLIGAVVMPDHVHLLATLGPRLSLPRAIGKLKAMTRDALDEGGLHWQENFYDHRLRRADECEPFARYIYLNPYRASLIRLDETWPHWWRWGDTRFQFEEFVARDGKVPGPWLDEPTPPGSADL